MQFLYIFITLSFTFMFITCLKLSFSSRQWTKQLNSLFPSRSRTIFPALFLLEVSRAPDFYLLNSYVYLMATFISSLTARSKSSYLRFSAFCLNAMKTFRIVKVELISLNLIAAMLVCIKWRLQLIQFYHAFTQEAKVLILNCFYVLVTCLIQQKTCDMKIFLV